MKKLAVIAMMLISLSTVAQIGAQYDREDRISNTLGLDPANLLVGGKQLPNGERRNPAGLNFKGGFNVNSSYWEFGAHLEIFGHIDYKAIGLSFHREFATFNLDTRIRNNGSTLAFLIGGEAQIVSRHGLQVDSEYGQYSADNLEYFNYSLSGIVRWDRMFGSPIYSQAQGTFMHRSDITDIYGENSSYSAWDNFSGYISIGFYFEEIIRGY